MALPNPLAEYNDQMESETIKATLELSVALEKFKKVALEVCNQIEKSQREILMKLAK